MKVAEPGPYRLGGFQEFQSSGRQFLYLVPSGGIFEMDEAAATVVERLAHSDASHERLHPDLAGRGIPECKAREAIELRGEMHGFSNVSATLAELHPGVSKSHPGGAGLGLVGVGPSGDIAPCRFVDSDQHAIGHVSGGIDWEKRATFSPREYGPKIRLPRLLGAAAVRGGAITRHSCAMATRDIPTALLRRDSRLDRQARLRIYNAIAVQRPEFQDYFA